MASSPISSASPASSGKAASSSPSQASFTGSALASSDTTVVGGLSAFTTPSRLNAAAREYSPMTDTDALKMLAKNTLDITSRLEPFVNLHHRAHGTPFFAQTKNHEPLTCFVYVGGNYEAADFEEHGRYHEILVQSSPAKKFDLPPSDYSHGFKEMVLEFHDVRDVEFLLHDLRKTGNPRHTIDARPDLLVACIAAVQYCNLLKRIITFGYNATVPTLATLPKTYGTGFDGQVLIQMTHKRTSSNADDAGRLIESDVDLVKGFIEFEFGDIKHIQPLQDDKSHNVNMFVLEMNEHGRVDDMISRWQNNPHGIEVGEGRLMFVIPFNATICDPPNPSVSLFEDNILTPLNAFKRRWHGEPQGAGHFGAFDLATSPLRRRFHDTFFRASFDRFPHLPFDQKNNVDTNMIQSGQDVRTTIMFRNMPADFSTAEFHEIVFTFAPDKVDFIYCRKDFSSGNNVGYAFVNVVRPTDILPFLNHVVGHNWPRSRKNIDISYATVQGQDALIEKFRNSVVMREADDAQPQLFYTEGHRFAGRRQPFPPPNNSMKVYRSAQNAETVGLFNGPKDRGRRGMYDRGNPRGDAVGFQFQYLALENSRLRDLLAYQRIAGGGRLFD